MSATYMYPGGGKAGSIDAGDTVYTLQEENGWRQVMYNISGGNWKIAWYQFESSSVGGDASAVIAIAKNEVGYKEKASNSSLYDKTANAGSNNFTKYAYEMDQTNFYNGAKNGYEWCDIFFDWCMVQAYVYSQAQNMTGQFDGCAGAGCPYSYNYYANKGNEPRIGAQIFYIYSGSTSPDHTGLVYNVANGKVYTIEGNSSNQVQYREYDINDSTIFGYGYPAYQ